MALFTKQIRSLNLSKHIIHCSRQYVNSSRSKTNRIQIIKYTLLGCGAISGAYCINKYVTVNKFLNIMPNFIQEVFAKETFKENNYPDAEDDEDETSLIPEKEPSSRELRFLQFASVELDGVIYMTPIDFLQSVTDDLPRVRTERKSLTKDNIDDYLANVPNINRKSQRLFRDLGEKGILSFTEYLFLICVLTRPKSGFKIAFNMFDMDGNEIVDRKEFLVMERILSQLEKNDNLNSRTTLSKYFFGYSGNDVLQFENFSTFMVNLQHEVLELEFNEYSKGMPTISESEFGKVLMRYTILSKEDQQRNLDRLAERIQDEEGIDFVEFKKFSEFLNNLDDFTMAMKMFSYAGKPITQDEFKRAVLAVTGQYLSNSLINVVFQLFDKDGDGRLSQREFISVMKDRIHRGYRTKKNTSFWKSYKQCVANEVKQM